MNRNTPWGETPLFNMHYVVQSKYPPHETVAAFRDFVEACEYIKAIHAYRAIHWARETTNSPESPYRIMQYYHGSWGEHKLYPSYFIDDVSNDDDEEAA